MRSDSRAVRALWGLLGVGPLGVSAVEVHGRGEFSLNVDKGVDLAAAAWLILAVVLLGRLAPRRRGARRRAKR